MGRAIFISYRRDDTEGEAGRLFDDLTRSFGNDCVFMDVAGIQPGVDFRKAIEDNVSACGVLLAMVGPAWATIAHPDGTRRLDDANDFVRLEIAAALSRNIAVIPVLVHDAKMPHPDQLPENLKEFAFRNSVELTHARWNSDVQLLIEALHPYAAAASAPSATPLHATVPVQLPPANAPAPEETRGGVRRVAALWVAISVAVLVAGGGAFAYFAARPSANSNAAKTAPAEPVAAVPAPAGNADNSKPPTQQPPQDHGGAPVKKPIGALATQLSPNLALTPYLGTWINPTPAGGNGLHRLVITATGGTLSIHAFGECQPSECDWGTQTVTASGGQAQASWQLPQHGRRAQVTIAPVNGALNVTVENTYVGRPAVTKQLRFVHGG